MKRRHGLSHQVGVYSVWCGIIQRCTNKKNPSWKHYGGRGITICDRWRVFDNFLVDMGPRPNGMTIERKDNAKGYSPDNCHWADRVAQGRNTSRVKLTEVIATEIRGRYEHGESISSIARRLNISRPNVWAVVTNRIWRDANSPEFQRLGRNLKRNVTTGRFLTK